VDLQQLAARVRAHPGLVAKSALAAVAETIGGDGDDAALLGMGDSHLVLAGEAIWPPFIAANPRAAGVAGVVTALNDLAATGARPLALLDTVVCASHEVAREVLDGLRAGARLYRVPVLGGHTTVEAGQGPALSTFAVGRAKEPLRAANARAGDAVSLVACLEGELVGGVGQASFFSHLRGPRRDRAASDLALLPEAAEAGEAWAARDVSMPGIVGSLIQMCESAGGLGCAVDVPAIPVPEGVTLERWLVTFPSYGFLAVGDPDALAKRASARGLACARIGTLDASGVVRAEAGGDEVVLWDLSVEPLTGLSPAT
jgi:selenophosphate synthetase-related protein